MPQHTPISAIVIFRNEAKHLRRCLAALRWCDEVIAVNMASTDGSLDIAHELADRVFHVDPAPIAEPTRVAAARLARHDWVLLVDPDEEIPAALAEQMRATLAAQSDAGAVSLPMWFYFKDRRLTSTVWGTLTFKQRLIHRHRCELLPWCNRITRLRDGYRDVRIEHDGENHMRHYWSDSFRELLRRHVTRYCHTEAKAMAAEGRRFSLRWGVSYPLAELNRTLRHFDGWRDGLRGWGLSTIYFIYVTLSAWLTLRYQGQTANTPQMQPIPMLREDASEPMVARRAA